MKIRIQLKDPDSLHDAVRDAVKASMKAFAPGILSDRECDLITEPRIENAMEIAGRWFECAEYVTLELDTTAQTMVVVPRS